MNVSRFPNKVALVVGGTSGIGRATALAFAREGAKVVIAGRREHAGEERFGSSPLAEAKRFS